MKRDWQTIDVYWAHWKTDPISPILRLLLSSNGTTIRNFNSLFLNPTALEIVEQQETLADEGLSARIAVSKGEKVVERSVWLKNGKGASAKESLLFATSKFPISGFKPEIYQDLELGQKPLGQIIEERCLSTYRDQLELAFLPFPEVAKRLSIQEDTLFWARRYRLSISGQVSAVICEIFSPRLTSIFS